MTSKDWKKLLGYEPSVEQKRMILQAVKDEGISLAEACGRFAMPPLYINDKEAVRGADEYDNPFRPPIVIKLKDEDLI